MTASGPLRRRPGAVPPGAHGGGRVLVVGDVFCDIVLRGVQRLPTWGEETFGDEPVMCPGGAANTAVGLARLGVETLLVARTGASDTIGRVIADELRAQPHLTTTWLQDAPSTALTVALPHGSERAMVSYVPPASGRAVAPVLDWDAVGRVSHLHVAAWSEGPNPLADQAGLLADARSRGVTTSLDVGLEPATSRAERLRALLDGVDLFMPNRAEACWIAQADDVDAALERLTELCATVVVKLGAAGAVGRRDGETVAMPAPPATVVDTTGAGDAFAAGFLYGHIRRWPLARCLRLATVCGSHSVAHAGSSISGPTRREAFEIVQRHAQDGQALHSAADRGRSAASSR